VVAGPSACSSLTDCTHLILVAALLVLMITGVLSPVMPSRASQPGSHRRRALRRRVGLIDTAASMRSAPAPRPAENRRRAQSGSCAGHRSQRVLKTRRGRHAGSGRRGLGKRCASGLEADDPSASRIFGGCAPSSAQHQPHRERHADATDQAASAFFEIGLWSATALSASSTSSCSAGGCCRSISPLRQPDNAREYTWKCVARQPADRPTRRRPAQPPYAFLAR